MSTAWMHPLACAARTLSSRLMALEKTLPKDPHDREGWRDYMETATLLAQVVEAQRVPGLPARTQASVPSSAARAR